MELNDGRVLYCAWISRDPEEEGEGGRSTSSFALASSFNSTSPLDFSVASVAEVSQVASAYMYMHYIILVKIILLLRTLV